MGLLDYYKQFESLTDEEVSEELRARAEERRRRALARIDALDLSKTTWHEFPHPDVVAAVTFAIRRGINRAPDADAHELRHELAMRLGVEPDRVVAGNGAATLLHSAAGALLQEGDELVTPWPSYPLYPLMAQRAGAKPVAVDLKAGRVDVDAVLAAIGDRTRAVVLCNPNDPTGTYLPSESVGALASSLSENVHLLVDEAYIEFQDVEPRDSVLRLVDAFPRLLVFRTFSKIYGLSGLRAGYAIGSSAATSLLASIAPALGMNVLTQAGISYALEMGEIEIARRREMVVGQRQRIMRELHELPVDAPESEANFIWLHAAGLTGAQLAAGLEEARVLVAPGGPLGADDHVRASIRGAAATDRLLRGLREATGAAA